MFFNINSNLYIILIIIFILFVSYQIYFYNIIYKKNLETLKKIESFENDINAINEYSNNNSEYLLSDESVTKLLDDFNDIKNNI
jgi:phosphotransferase system  glucose/maltose/N-acetylglucosamine-specific IIC component